ncbi:HAMP domain-containing sensor histidine kinase [uncultured Intestinimonas sp.]|uniref:sensor histidine kinase n=1 Tax=uncultured Intestinimonas sp. TaxID=1689265 RepID=UPI0025E5CC89|nr:HAMP domain-containing sensor histidine kinase [uncultured Intestinimonas sp.]
MRRRIFLERTLTVLAALVALLLVSGVVIHLVNSGYRQRMADAMDARPAQVQSILDSWEPASDTWPELDEQLWELDYGLYVMLAGREVYSSLEPFQRDQARHAAQELSWPEDIAISFQADGIPMVGLQSGPYTILALLRPGGPGFVHRPQSEATLLALAASGVTGIAVIVLLSLLFTDRQVKQFLRPLNALTEAARRVEQGDYSQPVGTQGQDGFAEVCAAFDHMQQHLLAEREKNAAYQRARTDLVAGISHDLRTPLTSVKGYLKGLQDGVARTPERQAQYLDIAYRKACAMEKLLERLFYFSKMETGELPLHLERTDLGELVRRFVQESQEELGPKGVVLTLKGAPAPHPLRADTEQLYRVLGNLTDNAMRYAKAEHLELTLTVWRERAYERLRFADNGKGVPEEQLPHLFELFWRGDSARGSRNEGSGLGLYIVKHIIEAHGGTVSARNDGGLVFEIALPAEEE